MTIRNLDNSAPGTTSLTLPDEAATVLRRDQSNDVAYEWTATTFRKTSRLPLNMPHPDGTPFTWSRSWNHERITNEAKALKLIANKTTIPVPELLDHGVLPDGRRYLVTKLINGKRLDWIDLRSCSRPAGQKHTENTPCKTCSDQAYANAVEFTTNIVLPQLATLSSNERGIDGFVMPPSWMAPDMEPPWKGKKLFQTLPLATPDYVFQHGDLGPHNFLIDMQTLEVKGLIDWEYAGYYPPGMERWSGALDMRAYRGRARDVADTIAKCLAEE